MISKIRTVSVALVVMIGLGVFGVTSASAGWLVNGTTLTGSAALSAQALVDESPTFLVPALGLSLLCSGHFFDELTPQIFGADKAYAGGLQLLGCNVTRPETGCALEKANQPIATVAVLALVAKSTGETGKATYVPETKTTFTTVAFNEANTCAFNGLEPVTGTFVFGLPTGQLSLLAQSLTGLGSTEGNNSLEVAGDKAVIDGGRYLLTLASDSKWSFD